MAETTTESPKKRAKPGPGRPTNALAAESKDRKQHEFHEAVNKIEQPDWGTRAAIWLYRIEPYTDRRRSGEATNIQLYYEPVDENRIMMEHGSGRYRLMLTFRKDGESRGGEIKRHDFECMNEQYPPKIPAGEWIDDPRNKKWEWARKYIQIEPTATAQVAPPQATQQSNVLETLQVLTHIEDRAAERAAANQPAQNSISEQLGQVKQILDITKGGGDSVLMQMFAAQLQRSQERSEKLEDELRARNNPPPAAPVDPFAQLKQLADGVKGLKDIGLFGNGESKETAVSEAVKRSRMGPWMELFQPVLPELVNLAKPLVGVLAQRMMQPKAQPGQPQPTQQPNVTGPPPAIQPPNDGIPQQPAELTPEQLAMQFVNEITPRMLNHLSQGLDGGTFAGWIVDGYGLDRLAQMQAVPPEMTIQFYKGTPYWAQLQDREPSFLRFLQEFAAWKPEDEDEAAGDDEEEKEEIG